MLIHKLVGGYLSQLSNRDYIVYFQLLLPLLKTCGHSKRLHVYIKNNQQIEIRD